jgi:hypothetical protein
MFLLPSYDIDIQNVKGEQISISRVEAHNYYFIPLIEKAVTKQPRAIKLASQSDSCDSLEPRIRYWANYYDIDFPQFFWTIQGESNCKMVYGDNGLAFGFLQFHKGTFNLFKKEAGLDLDYYNGEDQLRLGAWAFSKGESYKKHWTVWMNLFNIKYQYTKK